jgi:hypothetical protein
MPFSLSFDFRNWWLQDSPGRYQGSFLFWPHGAFLRHADMLPSNSPFFEAKV